MGEPVAAGTLAGVLALNGAAILMVSLVAGLFLHRALVDEGNVHGWHLLHAGGSGRGVMLLALAATQPLVLLSAPLATAAAALVILFSWTSTIAMVLVGFSGEHGFGWWGTGLNKTIYGLYAVGAACVFPGWALLAWGFLAGLLR